MNADIQKIREKLKALLDRARDAGSSDAEIDACMRRAQDLMDKYNLSESDLDEVTGADFREYTINAEAGRRAHDPINRYLAPIVGKFTGVKFYISHKEGVSNVNPIHVFGLDADVEYALWLLHSFRKFMDDQWVDYRDWQLGSCTRAELKAERIGFVRGFCKQVAGRLDKMIKENAQGGVSAGTDLIVKKHDLVAQELARRDIRLSAGEALKGRGYGSENGARAGAVAGNAASIGRGVGKSAIAIGDGR